MHREKIEWLFEFSPWIRALPPSNAGINTTLVFNDNTSIFTRTLEIIGDRAVDEINIISPYFDRSGLIIRNFRAKYPDAKINCLVDEYNGLLPFDYQLDKSTKFYSYHRMFNDDYTHRLHGKLIEFKLNGSSYLLCGSANATINAMGSDEKEAINDELSVLIKVPESYLKDRLDIDFSALSEINISEYSLLSISEPGSEGFRESPFLKIASSVIRNKSLEIILYNNIDDSGMLKAKCFDGSWEEIQSIDLSGSDQKFEFTNHSYIVCAIFNESDEKII